MATINVQFMDDTKASIVSYFSCPQDPDVWANTGEVDTSSAAWVSYYNSQKSGLQKRLPVPTTE